MVTDPASRNINLKMQEREGGQCRLWGLTHIRVGHIC